MVFSRSDVDLAKDPYTYCTQGICVARKHAQRIAKELAVP